MLSSFVQKIIYSTVLFIIIIILLIILILKIRVQIIDA